MSTSFSGVDVVLGAHDGVGHVGAQRVLAPGLARAQHVQADPADDSREPSGQVLDGARVGAAESHPGLLNRVVGFAERAEHPVGDGPQVGAVLLESLRQPVVILHRHTPSSRSVIAVTNENKPM
jgi:hypothetical protein